MSVPENVTHIMSHNYILKQCCLCGCENVTRNLPKTLEGRSLKGAVAVAVGGVSVGAVPVRRSVAVAVGGAVDSRKKIVK